MKIMLASVALAVSLSGCMNLSAAQQDALIEGAKNEALYQIDRLQELDLAKIEASPAALIGADIACSALRVGGPFIVEAMNQRTVEKNLERAPDDQSPLLTVAQFQAPLDAICEIVQKVLVPASAAPDESPVPAQSPV